MVIALLAVSKFHIVFANVFVKKYVQVPLTGGREGSTMMGRRKVFNRRFLT